MRLKYNILWFENDEDYIESAKQGIEDFLDDLGFSLEVEAYSGSAFDEAVVGNEKWNLILMDYDLGEEKTGDGVIETIRNLHIPTEVIFYSSIIDNVENVVNKKSFEGLYWCDRDKEFDDKVRTIIGLTLRKVMDVTNMRGLVMAECADIDQKMDEIITYCHDVKGEEEQTAFKAELVGIIQESCGACERRTASFDPEKVGINIVQDTRVFYTANKVKALQNITKPYAKAGKMTEYRKKFNVHSGEVINLRNNLAHVKSDVIGGKEIIANGAFVFDISMAKDVRVKLRDHIQNLDDIYDDLKEKMKRK